MAKGRTDSPSSEGLIAQAMAEATIKSGAATFPAPQDVPEARSFGPVVATKVNEVSETMIAGTQHLALAENPHCPPDIKALAEMTGNALATKAPPAPPVQIGIGSDARIMPASVRVAPATLHASNSTRAKALWTAFLGNYKKQVAVLAQQSGFVREPFVFLSQQLWQLIELENWVPVKVDTDQPFDISEKDPASAVYRGLVEWAGGDNARLVVRMAEQVGISVLSVLYHAYDRLEQKKNELLHKAQTASTVTEWAE